MADQSRIEWTDATWSPATGCDRISAGCDNCYALTMAKRLKAMGQAKYQRDGDPRTSGPGFGVSVHEDALYLPFAWRKPKRIFVNSMSDLFHHEIPDAFIVKVFDVMGNADWHTFQVLTKRPARMRAFVGKYVTGGFGEPGRGGCGALRNVWLGTSIESETYVSRAHHLRQTPAAVRFISAEPLLGPLTSLDLTGIGWVIAGGESGRRARPMHPNWVRALRDQCAAHGVAFLFKQWGEWLPLRGHREHLDLPPTRTSRGWDRPFGDDVTMCHVGRKMAGRTLDGHVWDDYPDTAQLAGTPR